MEEFKYTPLNLEKPAIRLLCLHPGSRNTMISCELFQAELHQRDDTVSYEALSYTWGTSDFPATIHVNGYFPRITRNLYRALLDLRYEERKRVLWIDAICIDQKNSRERGHQVGQMGSIYKAAERVIFRLGLGSMTTNVFMESLQRLQKESIRHACRAWSRKDSRWEDLWARSFQPVLEEYHIDLTQLRQGLQEILEQPWFRRVWILQEVALAKGGIISCGTKSVSAHLFCLVPLLLEITPDAHCQSVIDIMPSPWRESTWWSESRIFYKLLLNFGRSEATDPRDRVYALRGMSSDLADKRDDLLFPDYGKSEEKLVYDVFRYIYGFDVSHLEKSPHISTIRDLVEHLPRLGKEVCKHLARTSQPYLMENFLKRSEVLVRQKMIKFAAQYDTKGGVVKVLLRCLGKEFKINEKVLLWAAKNRHGAKVFEAFWCHQNQLIITERVLIATAENSSYPALGFLLSLETQGYRITPVLAAVAKNTSEYSRGEMIRMLLQQQQKNNNNNDIILDVLTAALEIQRYHLIAEIYRIVLEQKDNNNDTISKILTVATNTSPDYLKTDIISILLRQKDHENHTISKILTVAAGVQCCHAKADIIRILLEQKRNSNDTMSKILTVAAGIQIYGPYILEKFIRKNPDFEISRDAVIAAMNNWPDYTDSVEVLCRYFPSLNPSRKQVA
ncbi:heterokaryon incompatibility domain-containing protein [Trichoderma sp. SZMC 28015]